MALTVRINDLFTIKLNGDEETIHKLENDDTYLVQTVSNCAAKVPGVETIHLIERLTGDLLDVDYEIALQEEEEEAMTPWVSKGKPTPVDLKATQMLLELRGSEYYKTKFNNKNSVKIHLWQDIAKKLNEAGYKVTGEKCQQKFSNLQKLYINAVRHVHRTGTEKKDLPPFFDEVHKIIGEKDKAVPKNLVDTLNLQQEMNEGTMQPCSSQGREDTRHTQATPTTPGMREQAGACKSICGSAGGKIKPLKPSKADILKELVEANNNIQQTQNTNFNRLFTILDQQNALIQKQNEQRDDMLKIVKEAFVTKPNPDKKAKESKTAENKAKENKTPEKKQKHGKRQHSSSSSDSE